ncbi:unnamed protein product [Schistosoma mattheei]|uniref:Uncharacterized protein n=1 Tax=Schistosoma mattheei TaxID=31246 RepID=A0AA85BL37_9TREM|nr:unnamed protein product [Schistosoma mattheei]
MLISRIAYSGAFVTSLRHFAVQITEGPNQRHLGCWQYASKTVYITQMSIPELLTYHWRPLNIYRQKKNLLKYFMLRILPKFSSSNSFTLPFLIPFHLGYEVIEHSSFVDLNINGKISKINTI